MASLSPVLEGMRNDGGATAKQGSGNEIWDMYLDEVKEDDQRIADAWKEDSNGILVFTGLFSATVGSFIIEFYKTLSPGSNTSNHPSPPSSSMIWVNAMWLISLVLSLTSALIATLLQQWARRYVETPNLPSEPNHRARVRSFLFLGTERYKMRHAVQIAPALLHLSVYLFFAGLVVVFHTINKKVAIAVDVAVGLFALAYLVLSILPCLDDMCPYRTPMTDILWRPLHALLAFAALCLRWFVEQLHGCLVEPGLDDENMTCKQRMLVGWLESRENATSKHWRYSIDGLGKSIIYDAIHVGGDGDRKIVTRLFNLLSMGDKGKLRKFAAHIPRNRILELVPLIKSGKFVLQDSLRVLLQSCATDTHVSGTEEEERKRSLLVCLDTIHHIAKDPSVPDLNFVRANFANIGLMRALWIDSDTEIRFTSRSICALLAKRVLREPLEEPQLRWLQDVTGEAAIYNADIATQDHMNLKSFVCGVFSNQVDDLPTESFKETLAILLDLISDAHFDTPNSRNRLSEEVGWIQRQDPHGSRGIVDNLRLMFSFLPPDSGDAPPPPNIMSVPTFLYPPRPSSFAGSSRSQPEHITSRDSAVSFSDSRVPFPEPQLTHPHAANVPLEKNVQSQPPPPPPPPPPPVLSHYDVPSTDPRSHLAAPPPNVTMPSSAPRLTHSPASNVTPGL